jgi:uncharacterized RDD family membrane protein YckC
MKILPIEFPETEETIYAGFRLRLTAIVLDIIIFGPIVVGLFYIDELNYSNAFYTFIPRLILIFIYFIYFVKIWSGTPGKLLAGIIIVRKDGQRISWREAILREAVGVSLGILLSATLLISRYSMGEQEFSTLTYTQLSAKLVGLAPFWYKPLDWIFEIWFWGELIVLLFNKRKRALHDYIAGTVVIKKKYKHIAEQAN